MGKLNLKLMQGIEDAEGRIKNDSIVQESSMHGNDAGEKEISERDISDREDNASRDTRENMAAQIQGSRKKGRSGRTVSDINQKQVFSFRALLDSIDIWKAYATAAGQTMEHIGTAAMNEYIDRHGLTGAEQDIFTALKIRNEKR